MIQQSCTAECCSDDKIFFSLLTGVHEIKTGALAVVTQPSPLLTNSAESFLSSRLAYKAAFLRVVTQRNELILGLYTVLMTGAD